MRAKATPRPETARDSKNKMVGVRLLAAGTSAPGEGAVRGRRDRVVRLGLLLVLPLLVLAECDGPMFPDGVMPARFAVAPVWGLVVMFGLLAVLAVVVGAWAGGCAARLRGAR